MGSSRPDLLENFYYGKLVVNGVPTGDFRATAWSPGLSNDAAEQYFRAVQFGSFNSLQDIGKLVHGFGLFRADPETFVFAHVRPSRLRDRGHKFPEFHVVVLPASLWARLRGNLITLISLVGLDDYGPTFDSAGATLEPLELGVPIRLQEDRYLELLGADGASVQGLVAALARERTIAVMDAPASLERTFFIQALLAVLPGPARSRLTFATEVFEAQRCPAQVKLLYTDPFVRPSPSDVTVGWKLWSMEAEKPHPYADYIADHWHEGPESIALCLRSYESYYAEIARNHADLDEALEMFGLGLTAMEELEQDHSSLASLELALNADAPQPQEWLEVLAPKLVRLAIEQDQIEMADVLLHNHLLPSVAGPVHSQIECLVRTAYGGNAAELARHWSTRTAEVDDAAGWEQDAYRFAREHFAYRLSEQQTREGLAFVEAFYATPPLPSATLWRELQKTVLPHARESSVVARDWLVLTARFGMDADLAALVGDQATAEKWPEPMRYVALYLSGNEYPRDMLHGKLVNAAEAVAPGQSGFLIRLARLASRRLELLDKSLWDRLRQLWKQDPSIEEEAFLLSVAFDPLAYARLHGGEDLLALLNLWIAFRERRNAAVLLSRLTGPDGAWGADFASSLDSFWHQADIQTPEDATDLARSFYEFPLDAGFVCLVCDLLLRRFDWKPTGLFEVVARLSVKNPSVAIDDAVRVRTLKWAEDTEEFEMTDEFLKQALDDAFSQKTPAEVVRKLGPLAGELRKGDRKKILNDRTYAYARERNPKELEALLNALKTDSRLNAERTIVQGLWTVSTMLGHKSVGRFVQELNSTVNFLERLESAVNAPNVGQGVSWDMVNKILMREGAELSESDCAKAYGASARLSQLIVELGKKRRWSLLGDGHAENELIAGQSTPTGAVDLLRWLSGVFRRARSQKTVAALAERKTGTSGDSSDA